MSPWTRNQAGLYALVSSCSRNESPSEVFRPFVRLTALDDPDDVDDPLRFHDLIENSVLADPNPPNSLEPRQLFRTARTRLSDKFGDLAHDLLSDPARETSQLTTHLPVPPNVMNHVGSLPDVLDVRN